MIKQTRFSLHLLLTIPFVLIVFVTPGILFSQDKSDTETELTNKFIESLGYSSFISFDASNIKQFWIDKSVVSKNGSIIISLNSKNESGLFKIQLANVIETQDCKIDVIYEGKDLLFSVLDQKSKILATSTHEKDFIQYHVASLSFHLEDLPDFSFNLFFLSKESDTVSIKKIILSFSNNKTSVFSGSPGFDNLIKDFAEKGVTIKESVGVPLSDVQYLISKEHNKVFFKIPSDQISSYPYFYHIYPIKEEDLLPGQKTFNNSDFSYSKRGLIIPKPIHSMSKYSIIQVTFPSYPYSIIRIGQYKSGNRYWVFELKNNEKD